MRFQKHEAFLTILGRASVLTILVAVAWTFGVAGPQTHRVITIACLGLLFIGATLVLIRRHQQSLSITLPITAFTLLVLASFQSLNLGDARNRANAHGQWCSNTVASSGIPTSETIAQLDEGLKRSQPSATADTACRLSPEVTISQLPMRTRAATGSLTCAVILLLCSAIVFDTADSRKLFAITIVINALAMVAWGFVQRSGGNQFLIPGFEHTGIGIPFAGYIYKNAGAAALFPAIAVVISRLFFRDRVTSQDYYGESSTYRARTDFLEVRNLIVVSCLLFLVGGLAVSYSRGAWAVIAIASCVTIAWNGRFRPSRLGTGLGIASAVGALGLVWLLGVGQGTAQRVADLSVTRVVSDSRWSHWPDGWNLALAEFPLGSGLGTYRFATLPHQHSVHLSWYQYAHNQYLETFAELGLAGILLVLFGSGWLLWNANRIRQSGADREDRRWGMAAIVVIVAGLLHSTIDFVLILEPNLFLFASFAGTTLSIPLRPQVKSHWANEAIVPGQSDSSRFPRLAAMLLMLGLAPMSIAACQQSHESLQTASVLDRTQLPTENSSSEMIASAISILDQAVFENPRRGKLLRRRYKWHLVAMRQSILGIGKRSGQPLSWSQTHPANLFVSMESADPRSRRELRDQLWNSDSFANHASQAIQDLRNSLVCQPYNPQDYLAAAYVAPLIDCSAEPAIESAMALSNNSHDLLYRVGVAALVTNDLERATEAWQRSLSMKIQYAESIYQMAEHRISASAIAENLVPEGRLYTILRLINTGNGEDSNEVAAKVIAAVQRRQDLNASNKFALTAMIQDKIGDSEAALIAWEEAVRGDRKNTECRYELAQALRRAGKTQEALDQATLALAIGSVTAKREERQRFEHLINTLRAEIGKQYSSAQLAPQGRH